MPKKIRDRTLNIVVDGRGNPIAVCDADTGLPADVIYLGDGDRVTWVTSRSVDFTIEFVSGGWQSPFGDWKGSKKKGQTVLGTVATRLKNGELFKYSVTFDTAGSIPLDPQIIIDN